MGKAEYTHVTATLGLIFHNRSLLLLRRRTQPEVWAPPGGRLLRDENPIEGLQREVHEECGIKIQAVMPMDTWFGPHDGSLTLGILYVCRYVSGSIVLSSEHSEACWFPKELLKEKIARSPTDFFSNLTMYEKAFFLANLFDQQDAPG